MSYQHAEAFALMLYRADDGSETETIWNGRDGVTPFIITLPSGKQATHADWSSDLRVPDYIPPAGTRVFIDLTKAQAKANAKKRTLNQWQPGSPALVTAEEYLAGATS